LPIQKGLRNALPMTREASEGTQECFAYSEGTQECFANDEGGIRRDSGMLCHQKGLRNALPITRDAQTQVTPAILKNHGVIHCTEYS
jgi:hypothetical protein